MSDQPPILRLPLKVTLRDESVAIRDAAGISVCYIYYDDGCPVRRSARHRFSKNAAIEIGKAVARALTDAAGRWPADRGSEDDIGSVHDPHSTARQR